MEKFCINCKHCDFDNQDNWKYFKCLSPENTEGNNLINGKPNRILIFCANHRENDSLGCTKNGKFFEEK